MPMCSYPLGCDNFAVKGDTRCEGHQIRNNTQRKNEQAAVKKHQVEASAKARNDAEREARDKRATAISKRQQELAALQAGVIRLHKQTWSAQISAVYNQVSALRGQDPDANAGNNAVGNTLGGNTTPLQLVMNGPTHGVTSGDICRAIAGFDSSDSGLIKFRRKCTAGNGRDVLIHCS